MCVVRAREVRGTESKGGQMVFMEKQTGKTTEVAKVESRRGPCLPYRDRDSLVTQHNPAKRAPAGLARRGRPKPGQRALVCSRFGVPLPSGCFLGDECTPWPEA